MQKLNYQQATSVSWWGEGGGELGGLTDTTPMEEGGGFHVKGTGMLVVSLTDVKSRILVSLKKDEAQIFFAII